MKLSADRVRLGAALRHRALAFAIPILFLASFYSGARDAYPPIRAGTGAWLTISLGGILALALAAVFRAERARLSTSYRAFALSSLFVYLLNLAFDARPFPARFEPDASFIVLLAAFAIQWFWSGTLTNVFAERENFLAEVAGLEGRDLMSAVRSDSEILIISHRNARRAAWTVDALAIVLAVFLATLGVHGVRPSARTLAFSGLLFFLIVATHSLLRIYADEERAAGMGLSSAFGLLSARIRAALGILAGATTLALFVSSGRPLIPPDPFRAFFAFIARLLRLGARDFSMGVDPPSGDDGYGKFLRNLALAHANDWPDLTWLYTAIKWIALGAIAVGAAVFVFGPLLSRAWVSFWREGALIRYLRNLWSGVVDLVRGMRQATGLPFFDAMRFARRKTHRGAQGDRSAGARAREKKRELGRLSPLFVKLAEWGAARGISANPSTPPVEYALALAGARPELGAELRDAGHLFEKALYSRDILTAGEESRFREAVAAVLRAE
jgi:hypothetical protein